MTHDKLIQTWHSETVPMLLKHWMEKFDVCTIDPTEAEELKEYCIGNSCRVLTVRKISDGNEHWVNPTSIDHLVAVAEAVGGTLWAVPARAESDQDEGWHAYAYEVWSPLNDTFASIHDAFLAATIALVRAKGGAL